MANFLRTAVSNVRGYTNKEADSNANGVIGSNLMPMRAFRRELNTKMKEYNVDSSFARRYLNDGFSGGEKKRTEVLQMAMLEPKFAILDESDSGLDIDALKVVSDGINKLATEERGFLLITHYQRILNFVKPDFVSIFFDGRIVKTGGPEVALMLEERGYNVGGRGVGRRNRGSLDPVCGRQGQVGRHWLTSAVRKQGSRRKTRNGLRPATHQAVAP